MSTVEEVYTYFMSCDGLEEIAEALKGEMSDGYSLIVLWVDGKLLFSGNDHLQLKYIRVPSFS